jgi:hypothetical protein
MKHHFHLFYQCTAVENLTNQIFSWLFNSQEEISRRKLFTLLTVFNCADFKKKKFLTLFSKLLIKDNLAVNKDYVSKSTKCKNSNIRGARGCGKF